MCFQHWKSFASKHLNQKRANTGQAWNVQSFKACISYAEYPVKHISIFFLFPAHHLEKMPCRPWSYASNAAFLNAALRAETFSFTSGPRASGYLHLPSWQMELFFFFCFNHNLVYLFGFCMRQRQIGQQVHTAVFLYLVLPAQGLYVEITQNYCNLAQEIFSSLTRLIFCVHYPCFQ